jgi:hypothetical protein
VRDADVNAWPLTCSFGSGSLSKEIRPAALLGAALATMGPLATAAAMVCLLVHALRARPAPQHKGSSAMAAARRLERAVDFRSSVPRVQELQRRFAPTMHASNRRIKHRPHHPLPCGTAAASAPEVRARYAAVKRVLCITSVVGQRRRVQLERTHRRACPGHGGGLVGHASRLDGANMVANACASCSRRSFTVAYAVAQSHGHTGCGNRPNLWRGGIQSSDKAASMQLNNALNLPMHPGVLQSVSDSATPASPRRSVHARTRRRVRQRQSTRPRRVTNYCPDRLHTQRQTALGRHVVHGLRLRPERVHLQP